jgi:hypothetical protein
MSTASATVVSSSMDANRLEVRVEMVGVQFVEAARLVALATEQLHDAHPGDSLVEEGVDARDARSDLAVALAYPDPKEVRREHHQRNYREAGERQSPVDPQHRRADRDEREQIAESRDDARREQLIERFDVRSHARDQSADRIAIEEVDRQSLQVRKQLAPQVAHHALPEERGEDRLAVRARKVRDEGQRKQNHRPTDERDVVRRNCDVDHFSRQQRTDELHSPFDEQQ